jgi:hypothetical protein
MTKANEIKEILERYPQYKETLFRRGYLITDKIFIDVNSFPFYSNWNVDKLGFISDDKPLFIYTHKMQDFYSYSVDNIKIAIIGHAYNPFDMLYNEDDIIRDLANRYKQSKEEFFNKINELTGIFLIIINDNEKLLAVQDCSGMKSCYFGEVESNLYMSSHPQLIGDLCNLKVDPFVSKLVNSRQYNIGNRHLPGNMSPYKEIKRLGGNTYIEHFGHFTIKRFYPIEPHHEISNDVEYTEAVGKIGDIIHKNIELASKKWKRPAISLTGGTDSKTTLACANGLYEKFKYFSFHCKPPEVIDAQAAHSICENLGLEHQIYSIPENNDDIKDFEVLKKIIDHNTSYFKNTADHEIRKMITLYRLDDFDIELKSWASEIARVFLERKYKVKMPNRLTERHFSIFQTRYFLTPQLLKESDKIYKEFMQEIGLQGPIYNYEHTDLFYWEVRMGAWGTSVVSSLDFCHNVTMPFNNRKLIELFLSFPHYDRKNDNVHRDVIELSNKKINDMNVEVKNLYFHSYRILLEKLYYYYRTAFY